MGHFDLTIWGQHLCRKVGFWGCADLPRDGDFTFGEGLLPDGHALVRVS
jgi:hypothetical protein